MTARLGDRVDHLVPQLAGELGQFAVVHLAKVGWKLDLVEQRRRGERCHGSGAFSFSRLKRLFSQMRRKQAFSSFLRQGF
jgi:hypothetical protein